MGKRKASNGEQLGVNGTVRRIRGSKKDQRHRKIAAAVRRYLKANKKDGLASARFETAKELRISLCTVVRATKSMKK
jgi:DNA invertase Pin-like site-specific DNA recombinase